MIGASKALRVSHTVPEGWVKSTHMLSMYLMC
jgi:hypothetical protein